MAYLLWALVIVVIATGEYNRYTLRKKIKILISESKRIMEPIKPTPPQKIMTALPNIPEPITPKIFSPELLEIDKALDQLYDEQDRGQYYGKLEEFEDKESEIVSKYVTLCIKNADIRSNE